MDDCRADMIRKVGLLNHMGGGNLGDDATQVAVIQNIRSRWREAEIILFSMNPADTSSRHGIPSYPIRTETWARRTGDVNSDTTIKEKAKNILRKYRLLFQVLQGIHNVAIKVPRALFHEIRFLVKSFRIVKSLDLFVVSGGGQLLDSWGGPWKFPYTVFKWTVLAKLARAKCYFLNVGAGPLAYPLGKWFVTRALGLADYVSFRDSDSRDLVQTIGFTGKCQVLPDCVYTLDTLSGSMSKAATPRENPLVGLSPMAYCDPRIYWQKDQAVYEHFIDSVASFGRWLSQNDYRLTLFSTDIWFDLQTIKEAGALIQNGNGNMLSRRVKVEQIAGINQLLSTMRAMDYIVTCRFHGVVFAHLLNKPVIALSHHPKVSALMNDLGLANFCLDIRKCDSNTLKETFLSLIANRDEVKSRMADKAACYKADILTQFDQLFPQSASI